MMGDHNDYKQSFCINQKGFALPMVLGISVIIILVSLSIVSIVRSRVKIAIDIDNKSRSAIESHSAFSSVMFTILTSETHPYYLKLKTDSINENELTTKREKKWQLDTSLKGKNQTEGSEQIWNLYGSPIKLKENVQIRLYDLAGMVSPLVHNGLIGVYLDYYNNDEKNNFLFSDLLNDWQDEDDLKHMNGAESYEYKSFGYKYTPRNNYIQSTSELMLLPGMNRDVYEQISDEIVCWPVGALNYMTMRRKLLMAIINDEALVERIIMLRKKRELTSGLLRELIDIPSDETITNYPSALIKIKISVTRENVYDVNEIIVNKLQNKTAPFTVMEWKS